MTSEEKADQIILALDLKKEDRDYLIRGFDVHAAEARAEQREKVVAWMIHNGYSTGHGDTIEELLDELKDQLKKRDTRSV